MDRTTFQWESLLTLWIERKQIKKMLYTTTVFNKWCNKRGKWRKLVHHKRLLEQGRQVSVTSRISQSLLVGDKWLYSDNKCMCHQTTLCGLLPAIRHQICLTSVVTKDRTRLQMGTLNWKDLTGKYLWSFPMDESPGNQWTEIGYFWKILNQSTTTGSEL